MFLFRESILNGGDNVRRTVVDSRGTHTVEVVGEREVYICGELYEPGMEIALSDMETMEKAIDIFGNGLNVLMGDYEVLKYGRIGIIREIIIIPNPEEGGKVIDLGMGSLPEDEKKEPESYVLNVCTRLNITDDDLDDIMRKAMDEGIGYWCEKAIVEDGDFRGCVFASETVSQGATLLLHCDSLDEEYKLDRDKLLDGLAHYIASNICNGIIKRNNVISTEEIDGSDADRIVQCALFGDIKF